MDSLRSSGPELSNRKWIRAPIRSSRSASDQKPARGLSSLDASLIDPSSSAYGQAGPSRPVALPELDRDRGDPVGHEGRGVPEVKKLHLGRVQDTQRAS